MRNLKLIIGACLLISTAGCAYYDGNGYPNSYYYGRPAYYGDGYRPYHYGYAPYGYRHHRYRYYDYGFR